MTASDGIEAVHLFRQHRDLVRAVLLDVMMPIMDGRQALRAIREMDPRAPVILCSGLGEEQGDAAGDAFTAILPKPFTVASLLCTLARVLETA